jgi:hypothetical protein
MGDNTNTARPLAEVKAELQATEAALHTALHQALARIEGAMGLGCTASEIVALLAQRGLFTDAAAVSQVAAKHRELQDEWYNAALVSDRKEYAEFMAKADAAPDYFNENELEEP